MNLSRIKLALFDLGGLADPSLRFGIGHHHEVPGLEVGARGRGPGGAETVLDHFARDGARRELADGAAAADLLVELPGASLHLIGRALFERGERDEPWNGGHAHSLPMRPGGQEAG